MKSLRIHTGLIFAFIIIVSLLIFAPNNQLVVLAIPLTKYENVAIRLSELI